MQTNDKFQLVPGLAKKTHIIDLPLSIVLMDDKKDFPWLFLVPKMLQADGNPITQMNQLEDKDQMQLQREITIASNIMEKLFPCDRINIAAIGNMTPQLHVHVICRTKTDPYWPDVIWNKPMDVMSADEIQAKAEKIQRAFKNHC